MNANDLKIGETADAFVITAVGRANFEYAVPIRELVNSNEGRKTIRVDLKECTAMDSTFMGVLSMLALKLRKRGDRVMLVGASSTLLKLLRDLGVAKLFNCVDESDSNGGVRIADGNSAPASLLTTAETVAEAHKALVSADESNAEKFKAVIDFADQDVARLKEQQ